MVVRPRLTDILRGGRSDDKPVEVRLTEDHVEVRLTDRPRGGRADR